VARLPDSWELDWQDQEIAHPAVRAAGIRITVITTEEQMADELPDAQAVTGLLGIIVENGNLDQAKATAWGFVRTSLVPARHALETPWRCRGLA